MKTVEHRRWARVFVYVALVGLMAGLVFTFEDQRSTDHDQARQLRAQTRQLRQQTRSLAAAVEQNDTARQALCALREDRRRELRQTKNFLAKHPEGAFGFTAAEIEKGIDEKQTTLEALSILNCKPKTNR